VEREPYWKVVKVAGPVLGHRISRERQELEVSKASMSTGAKGSGNQGARTASPVTSSPS
jgi:hypothetical protein